MHHGRGTQRALNHQQLLEQVRRMLAREPRKYAHALRIGAVATGAGRNLLRRETFFEQMFTLCNERRASRPARGGRLGGKISGQRTDRGITQLRGHAPHVGLRVRIRPRLVLEGVQLRLEVGRGLRRQVRERGCNATPVDAVACGASVDGLL